MRTIWKFPLPPMSISDLIVLDMPTGADILTLQIQGQTPTMWAVVDNENFVHRRFVIVGTGHEIRDEIDDAVGSYVGTWQSQGFVWHLFDLGEEEA